MLDYKARVTRGMCAVCAVYMLAACTTLQVRSDYDHTANFGSYHTFTLMQREHPGIRNPLVARFPPA